MGEEIIETAADVVSKLSFKEKSWNIIKKILALLTIILFLYRGIKWWLNNVRLAAKLQLGDDTWGTIIWIKIWRLIYGFVFGLVAAYLWNLDISIWVWLQDAWALIIDVLA